MMIVSFPKIIKKALCHWFIKCFLQAIIHFIAECRTISANPDTVSERQIINKNDNGMNNINRFFYFC